MPIAKQTNSCEQDVSDVGDKNNIETSVQCKNNDVPENKEFEANDNIRVIFYVFPPDSAVSSLEKVVDMFIGYNVIIFDNGHIYVYLNLSDSYRNEIEDTSKEEQKDLSKLSDVYDSFNTFLLYRDVKNCVQILPENNTFRPLFKRLKREKNKFSSKILILLEENISHDQKVDGKLDICQTQGVSGEKNVYKIDFDLSNSVSLTFAMKQMYLAIPKVMIPRKLSIYSIRQLQSQTHRTRHLFDGKFPVQVSDEQRDDGNSYSEQVVSTYQAIRCSDDISYGICLRSRSESRNDLPVIRGERSYLDERGCQAHECPARPPRYPDYNESGKRLDSFTTWLHKSPMPETLCQSGFFFASQGDLVRCFQCGIGLKDFSYGDDPLLEHVRHSEQCPFLQDFLGSNMLGVYQKHLHDIDPIYSRRQQWAEVGEGANPTNVCRHPEYQLLQDRISSYERWPSEMKQSPEQMAAAGLYYTGLEDHVRCFACDGGLRRWDPDDDPWVEHCRWFPACPYALEQKGKQYIGLVQASVENENHGAGGGREQDWTNEFKLSKSSIMKVMADCVGLGYEEEYVKEAVQKLKDRGNENPSLCELIKMTDGCRERQLAAESFELCKNCGENPIKALSMPCSHRALCICCAKSTDVCIICTQPITKTIRIYMP